jgi:hypothetical protein
MSNSLKGSTDLRRINSLIHSDDEESVLAHFGVRGMKWGVRKASDSDGGNSSGSQGGSGKKSVEEDWHEATKGMSAGKKFAIGMALGPYLGAKFVNKQKQDASDPVKVMKKEKKALSNKIVKDFDKEMETEKPWDSINKEYKAKYGSKLKWNDDQAEEYSKAMTKKTEDILNSVATKHLAGTNYKITQIEGFNDFLPDFQLTQVTDLEHSALQHAKANERSWVLETEFDSDNFVTGFKFPAEFFEVDEEDLAALAEEDEGDDESE